MSHALYNQYWAEANDKIAIALEYENPKDRNLYPVDLKGQIDLFATLYAKYIIIYKKLDAAYDQIVHPQKRLSVRSALVATIGRMLEVKKQLVELENSDVHVFNEILLNLKLNPADLEIPTPRFYKEEIPKPNESPEEETLQAKTSEGAPAEARPETGTEASAGTSRPAVARCDLESFNIPAFTFGKTLQVEQPLSLEEAILFIQTAERSRQGKRRALILQELETEAKTDEEKALAADLDESNVNVNEAARNIQRVFRGYRGRKLWKRLYNEELEFLGMKESTTRQQNLQYAKELADIHQSRKDVQKLNFDNYADSLISTKIKLHQVEGPAMKEAFQDSFRQWYMEYKRQNGKFPDFPAEELWKRPDFYFGMQLEPVPSENAEANTANSKKGDAGKGSSGKDAAETESNLNPLNKESKYKQDLAKVEAEYKSNWKLRNEAENVLQTHDQEQVKNEKRREVEAEIKEQLFQSLEEELNNLAIAVDKAGKGKAKNKNKGKGKGKAGGKKGKKEKDLTSDRTMTSLVQELVEAGIMKRPQKGVSISDFRGTIDVAAKAEDAKVINPSFADVRRMLAEYCILPHGYTYKEEEDAFPGASSVLLCGPPGSGKTMLVNAVASELGGYVFDLSPKVTAAVPQYQGKDGVTMMLHIVYKVAKAHAPSVIYIDNAELVFAKKVPKDDTSDPKRIKKDLTKLVKKLSVKDGVLLIGTSSNPWDADLKFLLPVFQKVIPLPVLSYGDRVQFWKQVVEKHATTQLDERKVSFEFLARVTPGVSYGDMDLICQKVFTNRRVRLLLSNKKPFELGELIDKLFESGAISSDHIKSMQDFVEKLPLQKKRISGGVVEESQPKAKGK